MIVLIWPVMSGNGVLTGIMMNIMQIVPTEIPRGLPMVPTGFSAVVAGTTSPGAAGLLAAPAATPATAATTSAFAFFRSCNHLLLYYFTTNMLYYECVARRLCVRSHTAEGATRMMPAVRRARKLIVTNMLKMC